jgi:glucokinase
MVSIGIDLGGTNIAVGAVSEEGALLSQVCVPTRSQRPYQDVVREMAACVREALQKAQLPETALRSIGIGVPGAVDPVQGTVIGCSNIPWHGVPLRSEMQRYFSVPVFLENDATVAALAETVCGAAKGAGSCVMLTLGTGVGSGIVVDGKLVHGSTGAAGELGHAILIPHGRTCSCGREGCLETYTSARGIVQTYIELRREDPDGERMLKEVPDGEISSKLIGEAAHQGDPVALKTWAIVGDQLGLAMANSVTFSAPEAIFLMGGPAQVGEPLLRPLREAFERYLLNIFAGTCQIRMSELKANEVAILGAAALLKMKS